MPEDYDPRAFFIFMNNEIEIWKDVPNYEGLYQVSNLGRIKSHPRACTDGGIIKLVISRNGYLCVRLSFNKKRKAVTVHKLVAMAFLGHNHGENNKLVIDHINNIKTDNRLENLQIITIRENSSKDQKDRTSSYIGVAFRKDIKKWGSKITFNKRQIHLGFHDHEIDAHKSYQKALSEIEQGLDLNVLYPKVEISSKFLGIHFNKEFKKWAAQYKRKFIGYYNTELEAYEAREKYILTLIQ
jgi:hypothetical protein